MTFKKWLKGGAKPIPTDSTIFLTESSQRETDLIDVMFTDNKGYDWYVDVFDDGIAVTWCKDN